MNIILFGFKGCGKTTIGEMLAAQLAMQFIDLDRVIEDIYYAIQHEKKPVREIYELLGEEWFRELERKAVLTLVDIDSVVVATGGGAILAKDNMVVLKKLGELVYLQASKVSIKKRIMMEGIPAFLVSNDPAESFEKMYQQREKIYESIAAIAINTDGITKEDILRKIIAEVKHGK